MASYRIPLAAAALTVGLLLVACGGEGGTPDEVAEGATTVPELPEPASGPAPELEVAAASVDSPLPEVVVRQLNGDGGWVQFKNELPSEQPLLVWFWAPF